jgi:hypothetical protein
MDNSNPHWAIDPPPAYRSVVDSTEPCTDLPPRYSQVGYDRDEHVDRSYGLDIWPQQQQYSWPQDASFLHTQPARSASTLPTEPDAQYHTSRREHRRAVRFAPLPENGKQSLIYLPGMTLTIQFVKDTTYRHPHMTADGQHTRPIRTMVTLPK